MADLTDGQRELILRAMNGDMVAAADPELGRLLDFYAAGFYSGLIYAVRAGVSDADDADAYDLFVDLHRTRMLEGWETWLRTILLGDAGVDWLAESAEA